MLSLSLAMAATLLPAMPAAALPCPLPGVGAQVAGVSTGGVPATMGISPFTGQAGYVMAAATVRLHSGFDADVLHCDVNAMSVDLAKVASGVPGSSPPGPATTSRSPPCRRAGSGPRA
jgi:hypothetical protein